MVAWRHAESLPVAEQALALARLVGAAEAEVRALTVLGADLAYLGRGEEGVAHLRQAVALADEIDDRIGLERAYVSLTDGLTMLGRPRESARVGEAALEVMRGYGVDSTLLVANRIEALLAIGEWDEADRSSAVALRASARASRTGCSSSAPTSRSAAASSTPRELTSRPRARPCRETACSASTTPTWPTSRSGSAAGPERTAPSRSGWRGRDSPKPRRSASSSAPEGCARTRSLRRWLVPAETPTPPAVGSRERRSSLRIARDAAREASAITPTAAGLGRARRGRVRSGPRRRAAGDVVGGGSRLGTARPPAARSLLPLA